MNEDEFPDLDQLLRRVRTSALASLDAAVDIDQRLRDIRRASGTHDVDTDATTPPGP
jgi:hypothetical protein